MHPALTSFVGRRDELVRLRGLLSANRLVTITGSGGAGKTRLAEELARGLTRSFGEVVAAYLADAVEASDVTEVVAAAVGLQNRGERPAQVQLVEYLGQRRLLLLLDNCEHVVGAAASLASDLLANCSGLVIVATGRQPLHVPGEQLFPLVGLPSDTAADLFVARARLAVPDLQVGAKAHEAIERTCSRLDGMPLAVELAAGQIRGLGIEDLVRRLDGRLADLSSPTTVGPARQRTLRQTLAWSHDLLSDGQRALWRRLAVFTGGFTLDAAEAVAGFPPIAPAAVADVLGELVDQSLVVLDPVSGRYRLLEVVRAYTGELLRGAGEQIVTEARLQAWLVALAGDVDAQWFGPDQAALADRLEAEIANLRSALEGCAASGAFADGLRLANAMCWYWLTRASLEEGVRWYRRLVGHCEDLALEARAHWRAGYVATIRLDFPSAHRFLDAALDLARSANDALDTAYATGLSGLLVLYEEPARAKEAQALCQQMVDAPAADTMCRQWGLIGYGLASLALGDLQECRRACTEGAAIGRETGELWGRELSLRFLGEAEWRDGRLDAAETTLLECVRLDRQLADLWHLGWATEALGWVAVDTGRLERGARLLGISAGVWARTGLSMGFPYRAWHDRALDTLRSRLGARRLDAELSFGRALARGDALAFILSESAPTAGATLLSSPLSERELEVVALVADGLGNRGIADKLFLSPRPVEKHVQHAMDKLGLDSRAEIAAWYARSGSGAERSRNT